MQPLAVALRDQVVSVGGNTAHHSRDMVWERPPVGRFMDWDKKGRTDTSNKTVSELSHNLSVRTSCVNSKGNPCR